MKKILVTGGAGFIGHHFVEACLRAGHQVTLLDRLDHSGNLNRLAEVGAGGCRFVYHDLRAPLNAQLRRQLGEHDYVAHLAAATHVDRSIADPLSFVMDNVVGTCNVLDFAREVGCERFLYFSTDEVFGPAPVGTSYREDDRYRSGNPYAATKAGGEELAMAYANTYQLPVLVTHTMNVIGPRQDCEKFLPSTIAKVRDGEVVTIHADKALTAPGSRFYIHASEVAGAVLFLLRVGEAGQKYNVVGEREVDNLQLATWVAAAVGAPLRFELVNFHESRPGHDLRYALNGEKLRRLGWAPRAPIEDGVASTVTWYLQNQHWLRSSERRAA